MAVVVFPQHVHAGGATSGGRLRGTPRRCTQSPAPVPIRDLPPARSRPRGRPRRLGAVHHPLQHVRVRHAVVVRASVVEGVLNHQGFSQPCRVRWHMSGPRRTRLPRRKEHAERTTARDVRAHCGQLRGHPLLLEHPGEDVGLVIVDACSPQHRGCIVRKTSEVQFCSSAFRSSFLMAPTHFSSVGRVASSMASLFLVRNVHLLPTNARGLPPHPQWFKLRAEGETYSIDPTQCLPCVGGMERIGLCSIQRSVYI
jgi:hypothetical protein